MIGSVGGSPFGSNCNKINQSQEEHHPSSSLLNQRASQQINQRASKQSIIPPGLLRKVQEVRAQKGDQETYEHGQKSQEISERMRKLRARSYQPLN